MELDITCFFRNTEHADLSGSIAERGPNAGPETWQNAQREAERKPLLTTPAQLDAWRADVRDSGGWNDEEIAAMGAGDLNALFMQWVSGDIREAEGVASDESGEIDWTKYERLSSAGTVAGRMFRGVDDRIYFYIGS